MGIPLTSGRVRSACPADTSGRQGTSVLPDYLIPEGVPGKKPNPLACNYFVRNRVDRAISCWVGTGLSPKDVVNRVWKEATEGGLLTPDGWNRASPFWRRLRSYPFLACSAMAVHVAHLGSCGSADRFVVALLLSVSPKLSSLS
jgi:hypothetical protein